MIKKILKIKHIGKYNINSKNADLDFGKQTIIFGANKLGKTTLVSVFRSLKEGNPLYVTSRKTFGSSSVDKQEAEILLDDGSKSVFHSTWSNNNIEIFDSDFVHKNVFVGDKIESSHMTELHQILLDQENLELQNQITLEEANYSKLRTQKDEIKKKIGVTFDSFIKLQNQDKVEDVDFKIKENQGKQTQYLNQSKLSQLKSTTKLCFDFDIFEKNIKQTIDTTLEQKIKDHIESCGDAKSSDFNFLSQGIEKISEEKNLCPFCSQSLASVSDLISNMKGFFSATYKEVQQSIRQSLIDFQSIDVESEKAKFKAVGFEFTTFFDDGLLREDLQKILSILEEKQKDLSFDTRISELPHYQNYKNIVQKMNTEIEKLQIENINIETLKKEEQALKLNKERFSDEGEVNFIDYKSVEKEIKNQKKKIEDLNNDLKNKLNMLFEEYSKEIDIVLRESHANFRLIDLKSISNRSRREKFFCNYAFIFDDKHSVNISDTDDKPQFKNTLSDSDKRIFAFAFFIAKLKKDTELSNKIIVLDDPFTSLDEERRDSMINLLSALDAKQIIILSHSRSFVKRCLLKFNKNIAASKRDIKSLRLKNNSSNTTEIDKLEVNADNDFLDGIELYLKILNDSTVTSIMSDYDNIRKIIEYVVKAKYGHLLSSEEKNLPMKYFINQNCKSSMKGCINANDYQENHHDADDLPTPEELVAKKDAFINDVLPYI